MPIYVTKRDGSIEDSDGKVVYFSADRFKTDILDGACCFVCGAQPSSKEFNDEHILPNWILSRFHLKSTSVGLPNKTSIKYDRYTIPCCKDCNEAMGERFERPICALVNKGYEAVMEYVKANGPWLLFQWLSLIFVKTHLKDRSLRLERDTRVGDVRSIFDIHPFQELHHIHCVARSFYTNARLESGVLGSFLVLPAFELKESFESFDFADMFPFKSILLRIDNYCFVAVLDDSCAALNIFMSRFMKVNAPLSPAQLREVLAHLSYIRSRLKSQPVFSSSLSVREYTIKAAHPDVVELSDQESVKLGELMYFLCKDIFREHPDRESIETTLKEGRRSFLFDNNGDFVDVRNGRNIHLGG